ncbi:hypothetical protein J4218_06140 [Candidatus Pacearchaeota archaeon]|nr:hypothetical protein [Candidatus Pacearchaeota archaeon]
MVKLIKQGGGGFTIYLPKKWVDENKLSKGDNLDVTVSGKELIIGPKATNKKSEIETKLTNSSETSIRTLITNVYRTGYDRVKIFFNTEDQFKILQKIIKTRLIGFEVIKKEKDFCIIENITEPSVDQFDNILNKLFLNIEEIFDITKERLNNSKEKIEDYNEVEERIHKYDNFCRRMIIKQKLIKQKSELFWSFLSQIIHAQRELYLLNKSFNNKEVSKQIKELFETAKRLFDLTKQAYFENNIEILWKIHKIERETIYKKAYSLLETKPKESKITYHLASCIRQLHLSTSSLAGLIM